MEDLPERVVVEIFEYLRGDQLQRLRGVSQDWRKALGAAAGRHIVCKGLLAKEDKQSLTRLLKSHGASTRSITLENLSQEKVALLAKYCLAASSLVVVFNRSKVQKEEVALVLKLANGLKGLKQFKLSGTFEANTVKSLRPIVLGVSKLTLEFLNHPSHGTQQDKGIFLDGLNSTSVTALHLLNVTIDENRFGLLMEGFRKLQALHVIPEPSAGDRIAFSYDVENARFQEVRLSDSSGTVLADIVFKPPHGKGHKQHKKKSKLDKANQHLERFRTIKGYDAADLLTMFSHKLPPIASIRLEIVIDAEGGELEIVGPAVRDFKAVEDLAVEINSYASEGIVMECATFQARSVCLNWRTSTCITLWLLHHFPNLQDLYLPKHSSIDPSSATCGELQFPSLRRVFVHDEHKMSFWENLVAVAPRLFQINIMANSPHRELLATKFPHILIGVYAGPKHFQGPLSEPLTGVASGGRRGNPSSYLDFVPLGN